MSDYAAFAGDTLPIGNGSIVGILGIYNDSINYDSRHKRRRHENPRCDGADNLILNKDFEDQEISSGGWTTQVVEGPHDWSTVTKEEVTPTMLFFLTGMDKEMMRAKLGLFHHL